MTIGLESFFGPSSCAVFARDPGSPVGVSATLLAFILNNTEVSVPGRVRLDTTQDYSIQRSITPARSPLFPLTTQKIRQNPVIVTVRGTLSATPLGMVGIALGSFGSAIRRDLREVAKLKQIQLSGEPVAVVLPNREVYTSMAMSVVETHGVGNKVDLDLTFEQIRIVNPLSAISVAGLDSLDVGAVAGQNAGQTSATATPVTVTGSSLG